MILSGKEKMDYFKKQKAKGKIYILPCSVHEAESYIRENGLNKNDCVFISANCRNADRLRGARRSAIKILPSFHTSIYWAEYDYIISLLAE
jgi:hypothetical protein